MAVEARQIDAADGAHVVKLYETDAELAAAASAHMGIIAPFGADPEAPGQARRLVVEALRQWGAGDRLVDDVALLVSELATNAVRHADSCFSVTVRVYGATLRVAVLDGVPLTGTVHEARLIPQPLHGLSVVDVLCLRWGVEDTSEGKLVWAELLYESSPSPRGASGD